MDLPVNWQIKPLGEVATLQRGFDLPVDKRIEGDFPVFAANGPVGTHNIAKVKGPGVVTGRSGTLGKVHYVTGDYWPLNTALWVKNFHGNDPKWVARLLSWLRLETHTRGTGVPTLNRNLVHVVPVAVPPLEEQRRIAAILDKADEVRRKRQEAIRLTEELLRSLFLDMFGDPVTNPKGWTTKQFKKVIINHDSKRVPLKESDRDQRHGTYPYYGSVGIIDYIDDYLFDGEYLLISEDGKHLESRNRPICCIASGKFWVNNHAHVLSQKEVDLYFLSFFIELSQIRKFVTGIDQFKLNRSNLDRIPVFVPPMHLQKRFRDLCHKNQSLLSRFSTNVEHDLFNSLLQRAFRGEL